MSHRGSTAKKSPRKSLFATTSCAAPRSPHEDYFGSQKNYTVTNTAVWRRCQSHPGGSSTALRLCEEHSYGRKVVGGSGHKPISWSHIYATGSYLDGIFFHSSSLQVSSRRTPIPLSFHGGLIRPGGRSKRRNRLEVIEACQYTWIEIQSFEERRFEKRLTSHEKHLFLLLDCLSKPRQPLISNCPSTISTLVPYPCDLLLVFVFLHHVDGLFHVTQNKVAVAVICLKSHRDQS